MRERPYDSLLEQARAGDQLAFAELWRCHERLVWGVVRSRLGHANTVSDLVQQVCVKALFAINRFAGDSTKLPRWLAQIARNECTDYLRKEKYHDKDISLDNAFNIKAEPRWDETAATMLFLAEQTFKKMSEPQQQILRLVCWEGESSVATAARLGIKQEKVYDTVKAFRKRLKREMAENSTLPPVEHFK